MSLWKKPVTIGAGMPTPEGTMGHHLGIVITEIGPDFLRGTMPVGPKTVQPYGRLHGGASCVLAEELGSVAAYLATAPEDGAPVGLDINANHLRPMGGGLVTGTARPVHVGRSSQVWEIRLTDERERLVCISRLTVAVIPLEKTRPAG